MRGLDSARREKAALDVAGQLQLTERQLLLPQVVEHAPLQKLAAVGRRDGGDADHLAVTLENPFANQLVDGSLEVAWAHSVLAGQAVKGRELEPLGQVPAQDSISKLVSDL